MKTLTALLVAVLLGTAAPASAALALNYNNKGADGAFNPTGPTYVVDLAQAANGVWDGHPGANASRGIYDPEKWAVVFKFSSINIPVGTTVVFSNHPSRAPVVWLVDGNATIAGTVELSGQPGDTDGDRVRFAEAGPGGFRGGDSRTAGAELTSGFGPGGGRGSDNRGSSFPSYGTQGFTSGSIPQAATYGNAGLIPLIGGSGNGGYSVDRTVGGGAGGGALLLVARDQFNLTASGKITANGGPGSFGHGSGGAIRIVCDSATGDGLLQALGGYANSLSGREFQYSSGEGRIRLETRNYAALFAAQPPLFPEQPSTPVQLWPETNAPTARIVAVNSLSAPSDPRAGLSAGVSADLRLPAGSRTNIVTIETSYLPTNAVVTLRIVSTPTGGDIRTNATFSQVISNSVLRWQQTVVIDPGYHSLQVVARAP